MCSPGVSNRQDVAVRGLADGKEPLLGASQARKHLDAIRIDKYSYRQIEADAVLGKIGGGFLRVPFKTHPVTTLYHYSRYHQ
jgi:hypothetical protein